MTRESPIQGLCGKRQTRYEGAHALAGRQAADAHQHRQWQERHAGA
ncbi:hypothetical protein HX788_27320 [Pseudomonas edaphica]|uniref:Uncharacterized protein n=1 Tax=Pseudomonas edaphica TaxID=2006980 RepID=A0A7Y8FQB2_9PSED|nr:MULTISPECIES: hypothetical protein [Pseudomonas]NVZ58491.1 hypothetical protein [Pseudomonas edaphica]NWC45836.1 hypothetical protein [Pseudomonas sp. IPO3747]NWE10819.1 hypothetical protein [Pseudomonas edaphica]NWE82686.1 hypothetical protein [Pseudomonas edaphica]